MSNSGDQESNSSSNQHRVEPRFFGSPSLYQPKKPNDSKSKVPVMPPPGAENPYWTPEDQPPPPYTQTPSEPASSSSISTHPSAPPMEEEQGSTSDYSIGHTGGFIRPQPQSPYMQTHPMYPRYNQYGAVPPHRNYSPQNNTTGDVSWPWNAPPSATGQALLIYPSPQHQVPPPKKEKSCFEKSFTYFFYFLILCVILRLLGLINGFVSYPGGCERGGVTWEALPKQFTFDETLIIRVVSGSITSGHITLKGITDKVMKDENIQAHGLVRTATHVSPPSVLDNPDLTYTLTNWINGTVLEIYIPQNTGGRSSCINFDAVIYVPQNADVVSIEVQNSRIEVIDETIKVDQLELQTTNHVINFFPQWSGKELVLVTKNGRIELHRPIKVSKDLAVLTTNAGIRVRDTVEARNIAYFTTTNAGIDFDKKIGAYALQVTSTNGGINVKDIDAEAAQIKTTNARIEVEHSKVNSLLNIQSSNDPVNVRVDEGLAEGEVVVRTTNGRASLLMPWDHEGTFEMTTSSHNRVNLNDPLGWSHINLKDNHVSGIRYSPNNQDRREKKGHMQVITTNAEVSLEFAEKP